MGAHDGKVCAENGQLDCTGKQARQARHFSAYRRLRPRHQHGPDALSDGGGSSRHQPKNSDPRPKHQGRWSWHQGAGAKARELSQEGESRSVFQRRHSLGWQLDRNRQGLGRRRAPPASDQAREGGERRASASEGEGGSQEKDDKEADKSEAKGRREEEDSGKDKGRKSKSKKAAAPKRKAAAPKRKSAASSKAKKSARKKGR